MRLGLVIFVAALVVATGDSAAAGLTAYMHGGVTIADNHPDPTADSPGFGIGAGVGFAVSENFILMATAVYSNFPFHSVEQAADVPAQDVSPSTQMVDGEILLRLSPRGNTPPGAPVIYFLFGGGTSVLFRDPVPPGKDDPSQNPFVAFGIGFESRLGDRTRLMVEVLSKTMTDEGGAYFPIRVGVRF